MPIPLWTSAPIRRFPVAVLAIVLLTGWAHLQLSSQSEAVAAQWGFRSGPELRQGMAVSLGARSLATFITYAFVHAGWNHLLGNLWTLFVFGCPVESRMGSVRFVLLYITCAAFAVIAHATIRPDLTGTVIGASGAVSGILGCYIVLEPRSRFLSFVFLGFCGFVAEIPGLFYLGVWLFLQWDGIQRQLVSSVEYESIAWWAHLGGLACGVIAGLTLRMLAGIHHQAASVCEQGDQLLIVSPHSQAR
jgi:membrane associated rhomboid family serine protease